MVKINIDAELLQILEIIKNEAKSVEEWAEVESDDMFQSQSFIGGYDADEKAFCFSYYDRNGVEYWFQIELPDVEKALDRKMTEIEVRRPTG